MNLDKAYEPQKHEAKIYEQWEKSGAFKPSGKGEPFCIIMPPPNANGALHWGHAVGYTLTDVIARYARMQGKNTLWLPGTDHAGIETQVVYERKLAKEGKDRFDLGPVKFYEAALKFTLDSQHVILSQLRAMGFSADWEKLKFTLDNDILEIVYATFKQMVKDDLVYRGNRIINWCPTCQSGFADIELDHIERTDAMYTLSYGPVSIATTRPETIFADVAVAVNPKDKRYDKLVGQEATVPLVERPVPIIADAHVDMKTGTGALKVTPGHDPADYEIGKRHNLPEISVIDTEGKLVNVPDEFAGLTVDEGRKKTVEALKRAGRLLKTKELTHSVAVHDRCGTVIEPLISEQWFLRVKKLNEPVVKAIQNDEVKFYPARYKRIALNWLEQEHDWNIGRQNWFGIKIPVYYKTSHDPDKPDYMVATSEAEAKEYYGDGNYRAETDTFDTWFSSGQWAYATLMATGDFDGFYPTTLMGTAREILHKWVTRMIMFGLYKTGKVPFKNVYLWGLVTDEHGQKLSKSKGNGRDPLEVTAQYGTDALRMAGAISNTAGNDSPMGESLVIAQRNFVNKLWNVARYTLAQVDPVKVKPTPTAKSTADHWLLARLATSIKEINHQFESYRLNEAANSVYHLVWDDFADWYVEISKHQPNPELLLYALQTVLRLAHPFIPFVTEAVWSFLNQPEMLIVSEWPTIPDFDENEAAEFEKVKSLVSEIRTLRTEMKLGAVDLYHDSPWIKDSAGLITKLAGLKSAKTDKPTGGLSLLGAGGKAWLDIDAKKISEYRTSLKKKLAEAENYVESLTKQLDNKHFMESAPKHIVADTQSRKTAAESQLELIKSQLNQVS